MAKIKLTKGELKRQRDSLSQFEHYLPFLQLKKQQIQLEIQKVKKLLKQKVEEIDSLESEISDWANLLNEQEDHLSKWIVPKEVRTSFINIAGINLPIYEDCIYEDMDYDLFITPLWVDRAIESIRKLVCLIEEEKVIKEQLGILKDELRITTQRVNLFEKIKIPECKENVRQIRIYLGDQQANAVGRSKIAKSKLADLVLEGA